MRPKYTDTQQPESIDQMRWERDLAIQQLAELGYGLGEKPRTDGDCISRQEAIDAVGFYSLHSGDKLLFADKPLKELPSVQPERKKGKWERAYLDHEAMGERPSILYCSVCNQCIAYSVNFCPNCGADMRGE